MTVCVTIYLDVGLHHSKITLESFGLMAPGMNGALQRIGLQIE